MWLPHEATKRVSRRPSTKEGFLFSESVIDTHTVQAYRETNYVVRPGDKTRDFVLNIGVASSEVGALHKQQRVACSAFITACNPFSESCDDQANALRQRELGRELALRSLAYLEGVGVHPSNDWLGEPSFLVFGLTLEAAKALGTRLKQNAIVWVGSDTVPQLVLLR